MLLIGSRAAKYHFPDFRNPTGDYDIRATPQSIAAWAKINKEKIEHYQYKENEKIFITLKDGTRFEIRFAHPDDGSSAMIAANANSNRINAFGMNLVVASPFSLLLIKKTHICYPIKWQKTIEDYHFLKNKNVVPSKEELQAFNLLKKETDARWVQKNINLNKTNEEFFNLSQKSLKRTFKHDELHFATCYYEKPLFEFLKEDKSKALVLKSKFEDLSFIDKIRLVREECFAIALERIVIPALNDNKPFDYYKAFMYALERICTNLTKGWFREFAIDNYPIIKENDCDFVSMFRKKMGV